MNAKRYFWASLLPENMISKYHMSFAACNFSYNLISGDLFTRVYSTLPPYVGGDIGRIMDDRFTLVYSRLRKSGSIGCKLAAFYEQYLIFKKIPLNSSFWFYNLDMGTVFLFLLLKVFKPTVLTNVIVLDFTPVVRGLKINTVCLRLINKANGLICLSESTLFTCSNKIVLPGVVPLVRQNNPEIESLNKKFLLSGVLSENIAQTSMVLQAFSEMPDMELHVTKQMGNSFLIEEYACKFKNIIYHSNLPFVDYINLLHDVTYQLSTRDENAPENQCNFPSKIIEALYHNRVVISTIKYNQLGEIKYHYVSSILSQFKEDVKAIVNIPKDSALLYANQSDVVYKKFSPLVWKDAMERIEKQGRSNGK